TAPRQTVTESVAAAVDGTPKQRRPLLETADLADAIEAMRPGISPSELAEELGISPTRLRAVRREAREVRRSSTGRREHFSPTRPGSAARFAVPARDLFCLSDPEEYAVDGGGDRRVRGVDQWLGWLDRLRGGTPLRRSRHGCRRHRQRPAPLLL